MNLFICHLSDDDQTKQIRLSLQNRYERLMSTVNQNIQTILQEHQSKFPFQQIFSLTFSFF